MTRGMQRVLTLVLTLVLMCVSRLIIRVSLAYAITILSGCMWRDGRSCALACCKADHSVICKCVISALSIVDLQLPLVLYFPCLECVHLHLQT